MIVSVTEGQEIMGDKKKQKKLRRQQAPTHPQHAVLLNAGNLIKILS